MKTTRGTELLQASEDDEDWRVAYTEHHPEELQTLLYNIFVDEAWRDADQRFATFMPTLDRLLRDYIKDIVIRGYNELWMLVQFAWSLSPAYRGNGRVWWAEKAIRDVFPDYGERTQFSLRDDAGIRDFPSRPFFPKLTVFPYEDALSREGTEVLLEAGRLRIFSGHELNQEERKALIQGIVDVMFGEDTGQSYHVYSKIFRTAKLYKLCGIADDIIQWCILAGFLDREVTEAAVNPRWDTTPLFNLIKATPQQVLTELMTDNYTVFLAFLAERPRNMTVELFDHLKRVFSNSKRNREVRLGSSEAYIKELQPRLLRLNGTRPLLDELFKPFQFNALQRMAEHEATAVATRLSGKTSARRAIGVISTEAGMGKTRIALALIAHTPAQKDVQSSTADAKLPTVVVLTGTFEFHRWMRELDLLFPREENKLSLCAYLGLDAHLALSSRDINDFDIVFVQFTELLTTNVELLKQLLKPGRFIMDSSDFFLSDRTTDAYAMLSQWLAAHPQAPCWALTSDFEGMGKAGADSQWLLLEAGLKKESKRMVLEAKYDANNTHVRPRFNMRLLETPVLEEEAMLYEVLRQHAILVYRRYLATEKMEKTVRTNARRALVKALERLLRVVTTPVFLEERELCASLALEADRAVEKLPCALPHYEIPTNSSGLLEAAQKAIEKSTALFGGVWEYIVKTNNPFSSPPVPRISPDYASARFAEAWKYIRALLNPKEKTRHVRLLLVAASPDELKTFAEYVSGQEEARSRVGLFSSDLPENDRLVLEHRFTTLGLAEEETLYMAAAVASDLAILNLQRVTDILFLDNPLEPHSINAVIGRVHTMSQLHDVTFFSFYTKGTYTTQLTDIYAKWKEEEQRQIANGELRSVEGDVELGIDLCYAAVAPTLLFGTKKNQ